MAGSLQADLHGTGSPSTILVLSAKSPRCFGEGGTPSQQLRVYDVEEGSLRLVFRFTPAPLGCRALAFRFLHVGVVRRDNDIPLVLGEFSGIGPGKAGEHVSVPVVLGWEDQSQAYRIKGLIQTRIPVVRVGPMRGSDRAFYVGARRLFRRPVDLGSGVSGYGATVIGFGHSSQSVEGSLVAAVYRLSGGISHGARTPIFYQRRFWSLYTTQEGELGAVVCSLGRRGTVVEKESLDEKRLVERMLVRADVILRGGCYPRTG